MIETAIAAKIPLVRILSDDPVNLVDVLSYTLSTKWMVVEEKLVPQISKATYQPKIKVFVAVGELNVNPELYSGLADSGRTLVVVNPEPNALYYDAGVLETPKALIESVLGELVIPEYLPKMVTILQGLSLKEVIEVVKLASAMYNELTPHSVNLVRKSYTKLNRGVYGVDTDYDLYVPPVELDDLKLDLKLFLSDELPAKLRARGVLLIGPAGTGKSLSAKAISKQLDIPLYRLDLGAMMDKYIGESENNLAQALVTIDSAAPCVLLIDEVEKVFGNSDDSGVSSRMLSGLLWWLQEHTSKVLTIMSSNDISELPKELYRPGRIDKVIEMHGLPKSDCLGFIRAVYKTVAKKSHPFGPAIAGTILDNVNEYPVTQARLTELVYAEVKKQYV